MTTSTNIQPAKGPVSAILLAGLVAATLDACGSMTHYMINSHGGNPLLIWRSVAGGAFGDTARSGALLPWAVVGILFHFVIVFLFTIFFFFIYPGIKIMHKNLIVTGLLYGIFVWIVMNLIVLPFSNIRSQGKLWTFVNTNGKLQAVFHGPSDIKQMIIGILIIMFCVGLPISLIIGNYYSKKNS